jgi:alpha-N-arabinofuranosidase
MMNAILRHADRVKVACLAQLVNVIAPIMTENGGRTWKQTIFYPFFFASNYARGYALNALTETSKYDTRWYSDVPDVDTAATLSEDGETLVIFAVNRDVKDGITLETKLLDFDGFVPVRHVALEGCDAEAVNTAEHEAVRPVEKTPGTPDGRTLKTPLAPMSWNMLVLKKNTK